MSSPYSPKLLLILRSKYSWKDFYSDLIAGVVVGLVALPLAIAFAIGSGVNPEQGLYTAIVAGFFIALFGGSRVQVSGPTGAFIVVIYGIVQTYGYQGLALATIMAGLILIGMGLLGLGSLLRFIPHPLTIGFTSGIAVVILAAQIKDFFGLEISKLPANFIEKCVVYYNNFTSLDPTTLAIAAASLLIIIGWPRVTKRIPGSLAALIIMTTLVSLFSIDVATIATTFGPIPRGLPSPQLPPVSLNLVLTLLGPAFTIALLGAIESLLSAVVADGMIGSRHKANTELVAQGLGNVISPLFLGIPATGAIARTATNVKNGAKSPIAALIHSVTLLIIMLAFGNLAGLIPMPTLAAILVYVSYHMSEWKTVRSIIQKSPLDDIILLVVTFGLTVFVDLILAIEVGVIIAALQFIKRMEQTAEAKYLDGESLRQEQSEEDPNKLINTAELPQDIKVFELFGPLFFAAVDRFKNALARMEGLPKVFILRMRNVPTIDTSGLLALEELTTQMMNAKGTLIISGLRKEPLKALKRAQLDVKIGKDNLCEDIVSALARARQLLSLE